MRKQSTSETNDLWLQTIFLTQETGRRKLQFLTEKEKNDEEEKKKKRSTVFTRIRTSNVSHGEQALTTLRYLRYSSYTYVQQAQVFSLTHHF